MITKSMAPEQNISASDAVAQDPAPVDVEVLMEQVRLAVAEKRKAGIYGPEEWRETSSYSVSAPTNEPSLHLLQTSARVELEGETIRSHRPLAGLLITGAKRFSRYWVRKYTDPLFLRQGTFNTEAANALSSLTREVDQLKREVQQLREEVQELRNGPPSSDKA